MAHILTNHGKNVNTHRSLRYCNPQNFKTALKPPCFYKTISLLSRPSLITRKQSLLPNFIAAVNLTF